MAPERSMRFITRMLIQTVGILLIAYLSHRYSPGLLRVDSFLSALAAAFVLGLANAILKPIFVLLTLPITILTFGLFLLVVNGFLIWIVQMIVPGFHIGSFLGAIAVSLLISLITWILSKVIS